METNGTTAASPEALLAAMPDRLARGLLNNRPEQPAPLKFE